MEKYLKIIIWPLSFVLIISFALWLNSQHDTPIQNLELTKDGLKISYYLLAAEEQDTGGAVLPKLSEEETQKLLKVAANAQSLVLSGKRILWVDDSPSNNTYESNALATIGISTKQVRSTEAALSELQNRKYDAVISDFRRDKDPDDGYGLLEKLRAGGNSIPYIIYSASVTKELEEEAISKGATGETNRATRLFELVIEAVQ